MDMQIHRFLLRSVIFCSVFAVVLCILPHLCGNGVQIEPSHGPISTDQQQQEFPEKVMKLEMELMGSKQLCLEQEIKLLQAELREQKLLAERNELQANIAKMRQEHRKDNAFDDQLKQLRKDQKKIVQEMGEFGKQRQELAKICGQSDGIENAMAQIHQFGNFVGVLKDRFGNDLLKAVPADLRATIAENFSNPCQNCWDAIACHGDLNIVDTKCLIVHYKGEGNGWRSVLAKCPLLSNGPAGVFYFEVRVDNVKSSMAIGLATKAMPLVGQMVGHYPNSFGYSNNGNLHINGICWPYENAKISRGDTVGCGVNLATRRVIFTKNGQPLETSNLFVTSHVDSLFPCLSLENSGDLANANFGSDFKFSLTQVKGLIKLQKNAWDSSACHDMLTITGPKCLGVIYKENGNDGCRSVFAKHSIDSDIFYFELKVQNVKGCVVIGLATKAMPLDGFVGNYEDSYGYHGEGEFWINGSWKKGKTPSFSAGDVVGCGVILANRQLIFTKNGQLLDTSDLSISSSINSLFPCVSLWDSGDKIKANFGPDFAFDVGTLSAD